jgi:D-alanyl-D-alanine carboxypeptidase/D-alanyl-D-alanine carboxypeptidase (penicillin-binding protein 5/6)
MIYRQVVVLLKKIISYLLIILLLVYSTLIASAETIPEVSAQCAILINADNFKTLYAKNENERRPMASTTKIMTALITLEKAAVNNKIVNITDEMVRVEGSSMGLKPGDKVTLKSLAEGMLSVSGNDAANSAAISIAGSIPKFAELMNKRAVELNLTNTHFVTPSGLDDKEHYTTARDLALLAAAAMKNPDFENITSKKSITVDYINPNTTRRFTNHNKLLSLYDGCIGVKTGFTKKSGRCLVSAAERNGIRLIAVTLNAPNDWDDHKKLLDYGFGKVTNVKIDDSAYSIQIPVVGGVTDSVSLKGSAGNDVTVDSDEANNIKRTVELPKFVYAPLENGQVVGKIRYTLNSNTIATTDIVVVSQVNKPEIKENLIQKIFNGIKNIFT